MRPESTIREGTAMQIASVVLSLLTTIAATEILKSTFFPDLPIWACAFISGGSTAVLGGMLFVWFDRGMRRRQARVDAAVEKARQVARIGALIEQSPDITLLVDATGVIRYANETVKTLLGHEPAAVIGELLVSWCHPDDATALTGALGATPTTASSHEARFRQANGEWRQFEVVGRNHLHNPDTRGRVLTLRDLSQRVWEETRLRRQIDLYETLLRAQNATGEGFLIITEHLAGIRYANDAFARICGYTPGELYTLPSLLLLFMDSERPLLRERLASGTAGHTDGNRFETTLLHKDGHPVDLEVAIAPLLAEERLDDRGLGRDNFVLIARDITARRQAEQALRAADKRYRRLVESAGDIIYSHDLDGTLTTINAAVRELTGYAPEELIGQQLTRFLAPESIARAQKVLGRVIAGDAEVAPYEVELICKDGERIPVEANVHLIREGDRPVAVEGIARDLSARKVSERRLADRRFRALVRHASDVIVIIDATGAVAYISPSITRIWGYGPDDLCGTSVFDVIHPDDRERSAEFFTTALTSSAARPLHIRVRHAGDGWRHVEGLATNLLGDPDIAGIVINCRDVTERTLAEEALRESEARMRTVVTNAPIILFALDRDGVFTLSEGRGLEALGSEPGALVGQSVFEIYRDTPRVLADVRRALAGESFTGIAEVGALTFETSFRPVHDRAGELTGILGVAIDVTERRAFERQLSHQAFHDPLTDLPNRALFLERLAHAVARAARRPERVAVLFLDLDRFKVVNDSLGHAAGDELLVAVGQRLVRCLRPGDTVARFGGDEFAILVEDASDVRDATQVAERIGDALLAPFALDGHEVVTGASIGIVLSTPERDRPADLLRDADVALYRAKARGKGQYEVFDPTMNARAVERLALEGELRQALARGELTLAYQPQVRLADGQITGVEALVRWTHPTRGPMSPADFIPLAEETGLIRPLGRWVLAEACRQARVWQAEHPSASSLTVCINLSAREFQDPGLVDEIARTLRATGLAPSLLELEITEGVLMEDASSTLGTLWRLRNLGVRLAIDDFGTGYSSLSYLKRFPVDTLKIDKAFVDGLGANAEDTAIVTAIVGLAHTLGLTVIAEGVATAAQAAQLRALDCELGQGYHFAKPLSPEAAAALFHDGYEPAWREPLPVGGGWSSLGY